MDSFRPALTPKLLAGLFGFVVLLGAPALALMAVSANPTVYPIYQFILPNDGGITFDGLTRAGLLQILATYGLITLFGRAVIGRFLTGLLGASRSCCCC